MSFRNGIRYGYIDWVDINTYLDQIDNGNIICLIISYNFQLTNEKNAYETVVLPNNLDHKVYKPSSCRKIGVYKLTQENLISIM